MYLPAFCVTENTSLGIASVEKVDSIELFVVASNMLAIVKSVQVLLLLLPCNLRTEPALNGLFVLIKRRTIFEISIEMGNSKTHLPF